jgi:prepilin-type processing-associated H-X9-DG protein
MLETKCMNNQKVNGAAHFYYLNDNKQLFWYDVGAESITPNPYQNWGYNRWMLYVDYHYTGFNFGVKEDNIPMNYGSTYYDYPDTSYFCHANYNITTGELNSNRATSTYTNNRTLLRNSAAPLFYQGRLTRVEQPDYITMLAETGIQQNQEFSPYTIYFKPLLNAPHDGRSNTLFVDGHVSGIDGPVEGDSFDYGMIGGLGY